MRLAILGGGGFRVPLIWTALASDGDRPLIDEVRLYDVSAQRLTVIDAVLRGLRAEGVAGPRVTCSTELEPALEGADFVFSAIRVGGLAGRVGDERAALRLGVLGQETTGPGGVAYGLRSVPVAVHLARRIRAVAPQAWVINFTNPAGMITEAMRGVLGDRVIGICDTPSGLVRRIEVLLGVSPGDAVADYVGLNHLGWLRGLRIGDRDLVTELLADGRLVGALEEGQVMSPDWLQALGSVPNEYLYYYYFTRDAVAALTGATATRGEYLAGQQGAFYAAAAADPGAAPDLWRRTRDDREATYMAEARADGEQRPDLTGGGYERVALELMRAIARDEGARLILNVASAGTVAGLPPDAVVEVPCTVDSTGARPVALPAPSGDQLGLMQQMKAVERLTIEAALTGSPDLALKALALHPLVDSVTVARELLRAYRAVVSP